MTPAAERWQTAATQKMLYVIRHKHVAANANTKISGAAAVFNEGCMYLRRREQAGSNMGIKCYEINRRTEALED